MRPGSEVIIMLSRPKGIVAPSLLSSDFAKLASESERMIHLGADWLHVDIMDGHFVPNLTIGAPVVASLRKHTTAFLDCHMMVSDPTRWIHDFGSAGASMYTFHVETLAGDAKVMKKTISDIKAAGMKVGIAIKPATAVTEDIINSINLVDMVLVMTVEPGFGGQSFMQDCLDKVRLIRKSYPSLDIQVDGGLDAENARLAAEAGANVIVAGSSIFNAPDPKSVIAEMHNVLNAYGFQ